MLLGERDFAVHPALTSAVTANADDYTVEMVPGRGHFMADERQELARSWLLAPAAEHPAWDLDGLTLG